MKLFEISSAINTRSFDQLKDELPSHIIIKQEKNTPNLFMLKHSYDAPLNNMTQSTKGMIVNIKDLTIVAPAVPIPIETDSNDSNDSTLKQIVDAGGIETIQKAVDGVLFRIYHHGDQWHFSTNGMIYPDKGWRGPRTFADIFAEATDSIDFNVLNKELCYYVMLTHPDHHNVVKSVKTQLFLVQLVDVNKLTELSPSQVQKEVERLGDMFLNPCLDVQSVDQLKTLLNEKEMLEVTDAPVKHVGYIVQDKQGNRYRFESSHFKKGKELRGNNPDVRKIWISYRNHPKILNEYATYFPEDCSTLKDMDDRFDLLIQRFYSEYGRRFKQGKHVIHHSRHVKSLKTIHNLYLKRRSEGKDNRDARITEEDIVVFLNGLSDPELYYLINPYDIPSSVGAGPRSQTPASGAGSDDPPTSQQVHQSGRMVIG